MILKNYKILLWILFVVIAIAALGVNPVPDGYKISFVGKSAPDVLKNGMVIYEINGEKATQENIGSYYSGIVKIRTNEGTLFARVNGTLGINAEPVQTTNLKFGLDIKGGVHALIKLNDSSSEVAEQVKATLQNRINFFGLREAVFRTVTLNNDNFIDISIAGGNREELIDLLETQGKFEGKIVFAASSLNLKTKHNITFNESDAIIDNVRYQPGSKFIIDGIEMEYNGKTGSKANLTALIFSGTDIKTVFIDPQRSRIENTGSGYQWSFGIQISQESAERFADVTRNSASVGQYLDSTINLYLDGSIIDSLNIASSLKGRVETEISVSGGSQTIEEGVKERSRLQAILRSGALPTAIEIMSIDTISPTLGLEFLQNAMLAGLGAIIGVCAVVFIRYRKIKIVVPMVVISFSEVLIILGLATALGWTIDLAAIAAIIATVGTGVNSQIIIVDQALRGGVESSTESMREKFKRAFFIIFGSAGTMVAAMIPLMAFGGVGLLRGFAVVTVIGVLSGVLITRPAFSVVIERLLKKHP